MGAYLVDHPPRRRQFRARTRKPTGCIVMHTAESVMDYVGEDTGAEAVAAFIRNRTDPGSYHVLGDSDSRIRLVPFRDAAYGDGTGSNEFAIHVSAACRTTDWARMSKTRRAGFIDQLARGAASAAKWLKREHGITVPAKRITRAQSDAGAAGFITHGERDPGRRTDPGADFPWDEFLERFADLMRPKPKAPPAPPAPKPTRVSKARVLIADAEKLARADAAKAKTSKARKAKLRRADKLKTALTTLPTR